MDVNQQNFDWLADEDGSALMYVLFVLLLLGTLVSILIGARLAAHKVIARTIAAEQTMFASEAGLSMAIDDIEAKRVNYLDQVYDWEGYLVSVNARPFGAFYQVTSTTESQTSQCSTLAYVGSDPTRLSKTAIYLDDLDKRLFVTGETNITGSIVVPGGSLERGSIDGRSFRGEIVGDVISHPHSETPRLDTLVDRFIATLDSQLAIGKASHLDESYFDSASTNPITFFTSDDLVLSNTGWIPDGSVIATSGTLSIGSVSSDFAIYYGQAGVSISGSKDAGGQFLSRNSISVADSSHVPYPSLAYVTGDPSVAHVSVDSSSSLDGTIAFRKDRDQRLPQRANVVVAGGARVRGAILNDAATDAGGRILGTVVTEAFYFYSSPSSYINWLRDAAIDVTGRPSSFQTGVLAGSPLSIIQSHSECTTV